MCTGLEIAAIAGATASTAAVVQGYEGNRRAKNMAKDQANALAAADTKATQDANGRIAMRRRALAGNSLMTGGGDMSATGGKSSLGG